MDVRFYFTNLLDAICGGALARFQMAAIATLCDMLARDRLRLERAEATLRKMDKQLGASPLQGWLRMASSPDRGGHVTPYRPMLLAGEPEPVYVACVAIAPPEGQTVEGKASTIQ